MAEGREVQPDRTFVDHAGTWITENGWTRREVDGKPYYVRCNCCDAPVARVTADEHSWCDECDDCATPDTSEPPAQRGYRPPHSESRVDDTRAATPQQETNP